MVVPVAGAIPSADKGAALGCSSWDPCLGCGVLSSPSVPRWLWQIHAEWCSEGLDEQDAATPCSGDSHGTVDMAVGGGSHRPICPLSLLCVDLGA